MCKFDGKPAGYRTVRGGADEIYPRSTGCHPAELVSGQGEVEGAEIQRSVGVDKRVKGLLGSGRLCRSRMNRNDWILHYCQDMACCPLGSTLPLFFSITTCTHTPSELYSHSSSVPISSHPHYPQLVHRYPTDYPTRWLPLSPTAPFLSLGLWPPLPLLPLPLPFLPIPTLDKEPRPRFMRGGMGGSAESSSKSMYTLLPLNILVDLALAPSLLTPECPPWPLGKPARESGVPKAGKRKPVEFVDAGLVPGRSPSGVMGRLSVSGDWRAMMACCSWECSRDWICCQELRPRY